MCTVPLPLNQKFHYRFFVCKQQVRTDVAKSVVILKWETNVVPRVFSTLKGKCFRTICYEFQFYNYDWCFVSI